MHRQLPLSSSRATPFKVNELNQQFVLFLRAYCEECAFEGAIEQGDNFKTDLKEAWSLTNGRFPIWHCYVEDLPLLFQAPL